VHIHVSPTYSVVIIYQKKERNKNAAKYFHHKLVCVRAFHFLLGNYF